MTEDSQKSDKDKKNQPRKPPPSPEAKTSTGAYYDSDYIYFFKDDYPCNADGKRLIDLDTSMEQAQRKIRREKSAERAKRAIEESRKRLEQ